MNAHWLRLAARNLGRHGRRTLLTGSIVVVGFIATTLTAGFVSQSFTGLRYATIKNLGGHIRLFNSQAEGKTDDEAQQFLLENWEEVARIAHQNSAVNLAAPRLGFFGLIVKGEKSAAYLGTGTVPELEKKASLAVQTVARGSFLSDPAADEVLLGGGLSRAVGADVGDIVTVMSTSTDGTLNAFDATVAGVLAYPLKELDDRILFMPFEPAARLLKAEGKATALVLTLKEGTNIERAVTEIKTALKEKGHHVAAKTWIQSAAFYKQVKMLYLAIFSFMGAVLVVVVVLAVANTMTMSVFERTREVGVMLALGMERASIRNLFILEGVLLGLLGSALGTVGSLLVRLVLNASRIQLPPPPGGTNTSTLFVEFIPQAYALALCLMTGTLLIASWWPARRASRLDPVEALTHV